MTPRDHQRSERQEVKQAPPSGPAQAARPTAVQQILALQRGAGNAAVARMIAARTVAAGPPAAAAPTAGPAPLAPPTAARMGAAFGRSFDGVRVHPASPKASGRVVALTEGHDVHFQAGAYRPGEASGDWLIAHELTHVVQQDGGPATPSPAPALEHEADAAADAVSAGTRPVVGGSAPFGAPQHNEAWEHHELGDAHGGAGRAVTLECGITLTYGQVVALSADFYRSPEALMRAPRKELEGILEIMRREAEQAHSSASGAPTHDEISANNADYELATAGSSRAKHHSHSGGGMLDEGEGEDHEGHDHGAAHDGARGDHGLVLDGEHVEDAGPGAVHDVPSADAAFLQLAAENSSHFSPENIRHNFIPKHQLAIDYAAVAHRERAGAPHPASPAAGEPGAAPDDPSHTPGAAPSARSGELPSTGADTTGAPDAMDASSAGPATPAGNARFTGGEPGERQEAMAWMSNGFADHFLTDAFAAGHLISGNVGRRLGAAYFEAKGDEVWAAVTACANADHPYTPAIVIRGIIAGAKAQIGDNAANLALLAAHDELNQAGVQVKNAFGTEWHTVGDANLGSSPETRKQAELASKASRDAIQETLDVGQPSMAFRALDHIPDVARIGPGEYRPIAEFAEDPTTFHRLFDELLLSHDPARNRLYRTMSSNAVPMIKTTARLFVAKKLAWVGEKVSWIWAGARDLGGRALGRVGELVGIGGGDVQEELESGRKLVKEAGELAQRSLEVAQDGSTPHPELKRILDAVEQAAEAGEPYEELGQSLLEEFVDDETQAASSNAEAVKDTAGEVLEGSADESIPDFSDMAVLVEEDAEAAEPYVAEGAEVAAEAEVPEAVVAVEAVKAAEPYVAEGAKAAGEAGGAAVDKASGAIAPADPQATGAAAPDGSQAAGEVADDVWERARNALQTFANCGGDTGPDAPRTGVDVAVAGRDTARAAEGYVEEGVDAAAQGSGELADAAAEQVLELSGPGRPYVEAAGEALSEWAGTAAEYGKEGFEHATAPPRWIRDKVFATGNAFLDRLVKMMRDTIDEADVAQTEPAGEAPEAAQSGGAASDTRRVHALGRQTYAHGGFMGAAGAFMSDPEWRDIFSRLMPADFRHAAKLTDLKKLMLFLENNPVLSAYGSARQMEVNEGGAEGAADPSRTAPLALEWDVWLPQGVTEDLDLKTVKIAHGNIATMVQQRLAGKDPIGLAQADVKERPNPTKWMELFAQAIAMHRAGAELPGTGQESGAEREQAMERAQAATVAEEALALTTQFLAPPGGLVIDVKSPYSTPADVAAFVRILQSRSINVIGVGTFDRKQLDAVPEGVRRVLFFHGHAGLNIAAKAGTLRRGDDVMFNAGALLTSSRDYVVAGKQSWKVDRAAFQKVAAIKAGTGVHVGLYLQESDVSPAAIETIVELVNTQPDVFDRGFAYGNIDRSAETETEGSGLGSQAYLDALDVIRDSMTVVL